MTTQITAPCKEACQLVKHSCGSKMAFAKAQNLSPPAHDLSFTEWSEIASHNQGKDYMLSQTKNVLCHLRYWLATCARSTRAWVNTEFLNPL
jgi:hypothetical protein